VIHRSRFQHLDTLLIDTEFARCEIAPFGAQVLSFVPRSDGRDLLWCSAGRLRPGHPVRGGVPVCWPWFARQGRPDTAVQHGVVRRMVWRVTAAAERADGRVRVVLRASAPNGEWPDGLGWPAACEPELEVLVGEALELTLTTTNASTEPLVLTQALHTYLRVGDVRRAGLDGVQGRRYLDKLRAFDAFEQTEPWRFDGACDRIYLDTATVHRVDDPVLERSIHVESEHSASTVVWNPGADGIGALGDVPPAEWYQYLCVEAANCGPADTVALAPGATARLVQRLRTGPLGG